MTKKLILKGWVEVGRLYFLCDYFKSHKALKTEMDGEQFEDSYVMEWTLEDENGNEINEYYENISLSDFEEIYGNNIHHILSVQLVLQNG